MATLPTKKNNVLIVKTYLRYWQQIPNFFIAPLPTAACSECSMSDRRIFIKLSASLFNDGLSNEPYSISARFISLDSTFNSDEAMVLPFLNPSTVSMN
jgi:hypothetical protein